MIGSIVQLAAVIAITLRGLAVPAFAADLGPGRAYETEPYAPYDYHGEAPVSRDRAYQYSREPAVAPPHGYSYKDEPRPPEVPYGYRPQPRVRAYAGDDQHACLPHSELRRRLQAQGWRDFREFEARAETTTFDARRPDGLLYRLRVDRCTGVIVTAQLLEDGRGLHPWPRNYGQRY